MSLNGLCNDQVNIEISECTLKPHGVGAAPKSSPKFPRAPCTLAVTSWPQPRGLTEGAALGRRWLWTSLVVLRPHRLTCPTVRICAPGSALVQASWGAGGGLCVQTPAARGEGPAATPAALSLSLLTCSWKLPNAGCLSTLKYQGSRNA